MKIIKPNRRTFVKGAAAGMGAAVVGAPWIAKAGLEINWKFGSVAPKKSAWGKFLTRLAREVLEATGGEVKITNYMNASLGAEVALVGKLQRGAVTGLAMTNSGLALLCPEAAIMGCPLRFSSKKQVAKTRKNIWPHLKTSFDNAGIHYLGDAALGFAYPFSGRAITSVADSRSEKHWLPAGDIVAKTFFDEAGIAGVDADIPNVLPALNTNLINAVTTTPYGAAAMQWFTFLPVVTNLRMLFVNGGAAISKSAWDALPDKHKDPITEVANNGLKKLEKRIARANAASIKKFIEMGVKVVEPSAEIVGEWKAIAKRTQERLVKDGKFSESLMADFLA